MTATATTSTAINDYLTLDDLAQMNVEELDQLYRDGSLPSSMKELDGAPIGRMLAIRYTDKTPAFGLLRRISESRYFVWDGKSFQANDDQTGTGINRVNLTLAGKYKWFPFDTRIEASVVDGQDCILLDYDQPENPWFIRKIRDELREVAPGLFLGPAMWKDNDGSAAFVLWFALDTRIDRK